jgi:hypothetical protein
MSHNIAISQHPDRAGEIGRLTIVAKRSPNSDEHELRVSRVSECRIDVATDGGGRVRVSGQDLFALREMLSELPEKAFVRPADPVVVPRWTDGDLVAETEKNSSRLDLWERKGGKWGIKGASRFHVSDVHMSRMIDGGADTILKIVIQASGEDL